MKIIITENKLRNIQLNYLNTMRYDYAFYQSRYLGNIIMLNFPDDRYNYEMSEIMMEYDFEDFRLYIDSNFVKDFGFTYFPNQDDVQPFIRDWFEEKFGVKVKYVES